LQTNEADWLAVIGKLVEDIEGTLRSNLEAVYFGKTKEVSFVNLVVYFVDRCEHEIRRRMETK